MCYLPDFAPRRLSQAFIYMYLNTTSILRTCIVPASRIRRTKILQYFLLLLLSFHICAAAAMCSFLDFALDLIPPPLSDFDRLSCILINSCLCFVFQAQSEAPPERSALWSAESEVTPQRSALWLNASNDDKILILDTFILFSDYNCCSLAALTKLAIQLQ